MKKAVMSVVLIIALAAFISSCGGGGGGTPATPTYAVTYDGNTKDSGSIPVDPASYANGQDVTVLGNPFSLGKGGYTFAGWNTQADGSGTTYTEGQTFGMGAANVTLYAAWADANEPNNASAAATDLGTINEGWGVWTYMTMFPAGDTDWYKVQLLESADTFAACGMPADPESLSATITMTPPAGMDYDLEICPDATLTGCGFSQQSGSAVEVFNFIWAGTCGSDDSRSLYIKVYPYPASAASSSGVYSLHVTFN